MEEKIVIILNEMSEYLSIAQMKKLQEVILKTFAENEADKQEISNDDFLKMFLDAKRIEGCSERTIQYYRATVENLFSHITENVRKITTEEIRAYLSDYQKANKCSNVTVDNIRRNISSFFSWLEEEDYILKSPMKRIHKIKTKTVVKNIITDEGIFINITGASVARSCIVPREVLPARVNQHVAIIRCIRGKLHPIFANNMFLNDRFKSQLLAIGESGGATRQAITKQQLETLTVIIPPMELQEQFAAFVAQIDKSKVIAYFVQYTKSILYQFQTKNYKG